MAEKSNNKKQASDNTQNVIPLRDWPVDNVISIRDFQRQRALNNLRRLTGLEFHSYPESLLKMK